MPYVRKRYTRRTTRRVPRRSYTRKARPVRSTGSRRVSRVKSRTLRPKWENPIRSAGLYKLTYGDSEFTIQTPFAGGYCNSYTFSGNSPYDPDVTGVGVQPYGWDQLCGSTSFFQNYRCSASRIKIHFYPSTGYTGEVRVCVIPYRNSTLSSTDICDIRRLPGVRCATYTSADGSRGNNYFNYSSTRRMIPEMNPNDGELSAPVVGSPTQRWYWILWVDTKGNATEQSFKFDVEIVYYCRLSHGVGILNES